MKQLNKFHAFLDRINEKWFNFRCSAELLRAIKRGRKQEINQLKQVNRVEKKVVEENKITTTKRLIYFILINCSIIEIYSMVVMYVLRDLSPLVTLIAAVVSESISYAIYCLKSFYGTKEEKQSQLEREKFELEASLSAMEYSDANSNLEDECLDDDYDVDE